MERIDDPKKMQRVCLAHRRAGARLSFVPTMGALHDGHLMLVREARARADVCVVSIFVNPKQFDEEKDLEVYPRPLDDDLALLRAHGVDIVFFPSADNMYPPGHQTRVVPGGLGARWEGEQRAGHFEGMLTVVNKLFQIVMPTDALFGEKDFQQLALIRQMVKDFNLPIDIVPMPVMRELDGLAMSSRNARLGNARDDATCLYRALVSAQDAAEAGERSATKILQAARVPLDETPNFDVEYLALVDPLSLEPVSRLTPSRLLIAGRIRSRDTEKGSEVRLIDNGPVLPFPLASAAVSIE